MQGAPGRGAGEPWGGCRLAGRKQACGLLSQAGMGPLVASGEEVMPGCPQGGGGHREQLVLWGGGPCESESPHGRGSTHPLEERGG